MISVNNKLVLEPYKGVSKVEAKVTSGFATIKQKNTLVGLKLLADGRLAIGKDMIEVKKGQTVFFPEEILHASDWSKKLFNLDGSEEKFILGEASYAVAVK
jgi:hypothetical protein